MISTKKWSGRWESNPRRSAWEADILPLNYARSFGLACVASPSAAVTGKTTSKNFKRGEFNNLG